MPILPYISDTEDNITRLVELAYQNGVGYILPWFGMTLRAGSRDWYYHQLDKRFPGLKQKYIQQYGSSYECSSPNWQKLDQVFKKLVDKYGIPTQMPIFTPQKIGKQAKQLKMF